MFDGGTPIWNIPWSYRFSGVYQAPFGLMFSATFQADRGQGELTTVLVTNATIKFNPGQSATQVVNVAKNAVILPNLVQLDLSVEKRFRLTERLTLSPRVNIYNALNNATVGTWIGQLGSTYHRDTSIQMRAYAQVRWSLPVLTALLRSRQIGPAGPGRALPAIAQETAP